MRVLVAGGRDYNEPAVMSVVLLDLSPTEICQGGARGADHLAWSWAKRNGIPVTTYKADWSQYGRSAGAVRNMEMLTGFKPDVVVAFPGGNGTAHMVRIARQAGFKVIEIA